MLKKVGVGFLLLALFFVSSRVFFFHPLFFTHDFVHGARIVAMASGLAEGNWPVRWSSEFGYGYGMPLFEFYAPLPFFVGSLFYLAGFSLSFSVKSLFVLANLITLLGAYCLGKSRFGRLGGLLLAGFFTLAPYRAVNLFVRGAISEVWGMAFLPWFVYGFFTLVKKNKNGFLTLTLSTSAMILSHNLTALIALPTLTVCSFGWWFLGSKLHIREFVKQNIKTFLWLAISLLLGVALPTFYILPAFLEKSFTQLDLLIKTNYFDFHHHFLYLRQFFQENWGYGGSGWGPEDGFSFFLGYPQMLGLLLLLILFLRSIILKFNSKNTFAIFQTWKLLVFLAIILLGLVLLTTEKTLFFWEKVGFLSYLQFPWRFLSLVSFIVAIMGALLSLYLKGFFRLVFLFSFYLLLVVFAWRYFQPKNYLDNDQALYYSDKLRIRNEMSGILPDYLPSNLQPEKLPPFDPFLGLTEREKKHSQVIFFGNQSNLYEMKIEEARVVELGIAAYPGWKVEVDGLVRNTGASQRGLITVKMDEGEFMVGAIFTETPLRLLANTISVLASLFVLIANRKWVKDVQLN